MDIDTGLTLSIAPECAARLRRHPLLNTSLNRRATKITSIYFDTPGLDLRSQHIVLQLISAAGRGVQSIRSGEVESAGLRTAHEWVTPVGRNVFDFTHLDDRFLSGVFVDPVFRLGLHPVFSTEFRRKTVAVEFAGSQIDYCFDQGALICGDQTEPISEMTLRLKSGSPVRLFELALELHKDILLRLETARRDERGYALFAGRTPDRAAVAVPTEIHKKMSVSAACKAILRGCLRQMQDNVGGLAASSPDSEYLHQMRVALRRMRSAVGVFAVIFGKTAFSSILPELAWLAGELGPARNWDVFMLETLPPVAQALSAEPGLAALQQVGEDRRQASRGRVITAVAAPRYQVLLLKLGAVLNDASWPAPVAAHPVALADFARRVLDKRYRSVRHRGENLERLLPPELHRLRIAGKKLRYAAEFFAPLFSRRASCSFLAVMGALQDALGAISDAATTRQLLQEFVPAEAEAACLVRGWIGCRTAQTIAELGQLWQRFLTVDPFWEK